MSKSDAPAVPENLLPYLNDIAERLYSRHAAVMVGSGFSKNAQPRSASSPPFPDWAALGDLFYEKLHGRHPGPEARYGNVPTLAHELEESVGQARFRQTLQAAIPDAHYEPSELHKKLLSLPWTDVFTTNYDTLLERTCRFLTSQRYDIVLRQEQLIDSAKPRIIKLHGCVSTSGTYTVTEEDYRRYPNDYACFVNTVRQALIENTLCLVGFSGDDPNFLEWLGWIHDNLGLRNLPKLYLVGSLPLSDSQKKLFESRNIVSIDMSEYRDIRPGDHQATLYRFIEYLESSEYRTPDWPPTTHDDFAGSPFGSIDLAKMRERVQRWQYQRLTYPGWIVAPPESRWRLWHATRPWLSRYPSIDDVPRFVDLCFAFELAWRMEMCLCPILDHQIEPIEATIDRYLDSGDDSEHPYDSVDNDTGTIAQQYPRITIREMCHYLMLVTMRYYRVKGMLEQWRRANRRLLDVASDLSPEHRARYFYERALAALFELDLPRLKEILSEWPDDDSQPFWEAKRASLLSELGSISEAARILQNSLATIRSRSNLRPVGVDYSLASQESIVMYLLKSLSSTTIDVWGALFPMLPRLRRVPDLPNAATLPSSRELTERWQELKQYGCDPWNDLQSFESALDPPPRYKPSIARDWSFDIGRVSRTHSSGSDDHEAFMAFRFLLYCEESGIPFRIAGLSLATKAATGTLSRIGETFPYWAVATLIRSADKTGIDHLFSRSSLAGLSVTHVDRMLDRYMKSLERASVEIASGSPTATNFGVRMATIIPEIISRLCCRCSDESRGTLVDFLYRIYQSKDRIRFYGIKNLTRRLVASLSASALIDLLPKFLEFPILDDPDSGLDAEYVNPIVFYRVERIRRLAHPPAVTTRRLGEYVDGAFSDNMRRRSWCISTLSQLHEIGCLDPSVTEEFARALWAKRDKDGFPSDTGDWRYLILVLPHPPCYDPVALLKGWIEQQRFSSYWLSSGDGGVMTIQHTDPEPLHDEIREASRRVGWSADETASIVRKLAGSWDSTKQYVYWSDEEASDYRRRFSSAMVKTLTAVIGAGEIALGDSDTLRILERLSQEFNDHSVPACRFERACLRAFADRRDGILERIEMGMASSCDEVARDAFFAIDVIAKEVETSGIHEARPDLVRLVAIAGQAVRWRSGAALESALGTLATIATDHPWAFDNDTIEGSVLEGLRHLIEETAVHAPPSPLASIVESRWSVGKRLFVRREAAGLAYSLFQNYQRNGLDPPDVLLRWQSLCQSDAEFAEIRNRWLD